MNDINQSRKKQKITYTATPEGIERAKRALSRGGFGSKSNFAKSILISRSTVTKFFGQKPIQLDSFQKICQELELSDWKEIAGIKERLIDKANEEELAIRKLSRKFIKEEAYVQTIEEIEQKTTIDNNGLRVLLEPQEDGRYIITIKLNGDINSAIKKSLEIEKTLEDNGKSLKLSKMIDGCIKLILEGSEKDIINLTEKIQSKEISEIAGFPIIDKWELIKEIKEHGAANRNLKEFDFSDTDLSNVNFQNANLHECDLSGADLSGADLSGADLSGADLSGADLSGADLSGADLSGADLKNTQIDQTTQEKSIFLSQKRTNLLQWFEEIFEGNWQSLETVFGSETSHEQFSFKLASPSSIEDKELIRTRVKEINIGKNMKLFLILSIKPFTDEEFEIFVEVKTKDKNFFPSNFELSAKSETGENIFRVKANKTLKHISLNSFLRNRGENFTVQLHLGELYLTVVEKFSLTKQSKKL